MKKTQSQKPPKQQEFLFMQTQPDEEDEDNEYFTANARDQRFLSIKQASKIDYYRKENE